jgi:hypothetical protein
VTVVTAPLHQPVAVDKLDLASLVYEARQEYAAELHIPLAAIAPPTMLDGWDASECAKHGPTRDLNEWCRCRAVYKEEPESHLGRTVSGRLLRYTGHAEGQGRHFEVTRALYYVNQWCRREHRHSPDHLERPPREAAIGSVSWHLCGRLARKVVREHQPLSTGPPDGAKLLNLLVIEASLSEALSIPKTVRWLEGALREAWEIRARSVERALTN